MSRLSARFIFETTERIPTKLGFREQGIYTKRCEVNLILVRTRSMSLPLYMKVNLNSFSS
jgi:hypothetical protein